MDIKFNCPSCAYEILSLERYKGQKITCPNCQDKVLVPEASTIRESDKLLKPRKEPTEIERVTEHIRSDLSTIKFLLLILVIGILVLVLIAVKYYIDYTALKEALSKL